MKREMKMLLGVIVALSVSLQTMHADERTGMEIKNLVKSLDKDISEAKEKVEKLEQARRVDNHSDGGKILPERAEALRELDKITERIDNEKDYEKRKALEKQLEKQVVKVATLSADYLQSHKDDLLNQDRQLEIMEDALASVINKMSRLQKITKKELEDGSAYGVERAKTKERQNLKKMAVIIEMMAAKTGSSHHWRSIRQAIKLRNDILKKRTMKDNNIHRMLAAQREVYAMVMSQISVVRDDIKEEKELLAQVAVGEIARSLLRKAAGLLLGNHDIESIGKASLNQLEKRQNQLLSFMKQDEVNSTNTYYSTDLDLSDDYPAGYDDFLSEDIN